MLLVPSLHLMITMPGHKILNLAHLGVQLTLILTYPFYWPKYFVRYVNFFIVAFG